MGLKEEIEQTRKQVVTDGYEMSIGELLNMYRSQELLINPEYQRFYRWDSTQKSRFVESILLGIPIPPIFVFQNESGVWELVDGLQRVSTLLELVGELKTDDSKSLPPLILEGTKYLPSLSGKRWDDGEDGIGLPNQIAVKRSRLRVEILKRESDEFAKYELFQRLNTGGSQLSEQEVRNAVAMMVNPKLFRWLKDRANDAQFVEILQLTDKAKDRQDPMEHALKFLALQKLPYSSRLDVNEYLDDCLMKLSKDSGLDLDEETKVFNRCISLIHSALGPNAFRKFEGGQFKGGFLISMYELLTSGICANLREIEEQTTPREFVKSKAIGVWGDARFAESVGGGVRGTSRLSTIVKFAPDYFKP